ncbi:hypothetical protein O3P69_010117, partial [Scylla paramamosain]
DWRTNLVVQFDRGPPTGSQTSVEVQVTPLTPSVRQLLSSTSSWAMTCRCARLKGSCRLMCFGLSTSEPGSVW